ncbi:hypothetical protein Ddye_012974 [Dipteronia dyeriana]|uniref:Reverse transcriptase n=1 Tax=Dipteronia dyeriana TaxID=168575 RepID=A0AAD9X5A9_9ROSI|nr:hypothetical protein Ddye_012974 [Dipteronia dyeriana]
METFRVALDDCELQDIGFSGQSFTWCNKREGVAMIHERLDRCVCNFQWKNLFVDAKKVWPTVGERVIKACLGVLNEGHVLDLVYRTLIVLIPKVKRSERIFEFHLISLCNVLYEIVAKALVNRFRNVLKEMISETQSAFILGL